MTTCGHNPAFRRDLCRTCYRKLGDAGLPLGEDGRTARGNRATAARLSQASQERLDAVAQRMTSEARERLQRSLQRAAEGG